MKKLLVFICFVCLSVNAKSQTLNPNTPIPVDKTIRKGFLPNGMTYYIKSTKVIKNVASYYIIQNVGSTLEKENQRGLAHFLEHMAFNGTKNFPGKGILNTLEKHGAVFGRDINAYTSYDETVYNLNNISTNGQLIDTCLLVLHDWSHYLLLTSKEIDAERGVIKEEWRSRQSGQSRLRKKALPILYNYSKYSKRSPIGLMSIVENFKYKALRDFYHDWYRTDLQAIAVIGDVNVAEVEQKIKSLFSDIPAVKNPKKRFVIDIPNNDTLLYHLGTDPKVSTSSINFSIRHKNSLAPETITDFKRSLLEEMVVSMVSSRISEKAQKPTTPFLYAGVGYGSFTRTSNSFTIYILPKPGKQQVAFKSVLTEVMRAVKFGFTSSEIMRKITEILTFYKTKITQKESQSHESIAYSIKNNYLNNKTIVDIEKEYALAKQLLANLNPKELHQTIQRLYAKNNRTLNVVGVQGKNNLTKKKALQIINTLENDSKLTPYKDTFNEKTLFGGIKIKKGEIIKTELNKSLGSTTFILSNGIKVHYKFADKQKNSVSLQAISYGGESLLKDQDLTSASQVTSLTLMSGLADYSSIELRKILSGKMASLSPYVSELTEGFIGGSTTKDTEVMLQMLYLYFEKPRFDKQSFELLKQELNTNLISRSKNTDAKIQDKITEILYGKNNPRVLFFNQQFIDDISFDKIKSIYKVRFANPADFDFYIVGDIKTEQLKPLITKYIASLPTTNSKETFKDKSLHWLHKKIDRDVYLEMKNPKTRVRILYNKTIQYSLKNKYVASILGGIIRLRLIETLREQKAGVYSPSAYANVLKRPKPKTYLSINFSCNPNLAEQLINISHRELNKIAKGIINQDDLEKTKKSILEDYQKNKNNNAYEMSLLKTFYREGYNINNPKNFENIIKNISKKDVQKFMNNLLQHGKSYEIVFKPKK